MKRWILVLCAVLSLTVHARAEAGVMQFARGGWRGPMTVNDIPQTRKRGGQALPLRLALSKSAEVKLSITVNTR